MPSIIDAVKLPPHHTDQAIDLLLRQSPSTIQLPPTPNHTDQGQHQQAFRCLHATWRPPSLFLYSTLAKSAGSTVLLVHPHRASSISPSYILVNNLAIIAIAGICRGRTYLSYSLNLGSWPVKISQRQPHQHLGTGHGHRNASLRCLHKPCLMLTASWIYDRSFAPIDRVCRFSR